MSEPSKKRAKTDNQTLIKKYENIKSFIQDHGAEARKGEATDHVVQQLENLKEVYSIIQNEANRDTIVQLKDSEIFSDTSKFAALNAQNLNLGDTSTTLSCEDLVTNIRQYMNQFDAANNNNNDNDNDNDPNANSEEKFNSFNWLKLGALFLQTSSKPILVDSLFGPLETERKKPSTRSKNLDDTQKVSSSTAQNMLAGDIQGDEQQNTAHMVKNVYRQFIEKSQGKRVNFFEFFINPKSFGQSVENLFFSSFLVRDGRLKFEYEDGIPYIKQVESTDLNTENNENYHLIASLNHETWKKIINKFQITTNFIDHRHEVEDVFTDQEYISNIN